MAQKVRVRIHGEEKFRILHHGEKKTHGEGSQPCVVYRLRLRSARKREIHEFESSHFITSESAFQQSGVRQQGRRSSLDAVDKKPSIRKHEDGL